MVASLPISGRVPILVSPLEVVYYIITSVDSFKNFTYFEVSDISHISDHCPISFQLSTETSHVCAKELNSLSLELLNEAQERSEPSMDPIHLSCVEMVLNIGRVSEEKLSEAFVNKEFLYSLEKFESNLAHSSLEECASAFSCLLQTTLKGISAKKPARSQTNSFPQNPSFDSECKESKRLFKVIAKRMKSDPNNVKLREVFWSERKAYKSLLRNEKREAIDRKVPLGDFGNQE